ncbi:MAG: hypothetical protein ACK48A_00665, partial [Pseudanabaena sp.]
QSVIYKAHHNERDRWPEPSVSKTPMGEMRRSARHLSLRVWCPNQADDSYNLIKDPKSRVNYGSHH